MSQATDTTIPALSRAYSAVSADPEHLWNHTKAQLALLLLADSDVLAHAYALATNVCAQMLSDFSVELENMILRAPDVQSSTQVSPISVSDIKDRKASRRWLEENAPASGTFRLPQEEAVSEMGGAVKRALRALSRVRSSLEALESPSAVDYDLARELVYQAAEPVLESESSSITDVMDITALRDVIEKPAYRGYRVWPSDDISLRWDGVVGSVWWGDARYAPARFSIQVGDRAGGWSGPRVTAVTDVDFSVESETDATSIVAATYSGEEGVRGIVSAISLPSKGAVSAMAGPWGSASEMKAAMQAMVDTVAQLRPLSSEAAAVARGAGCTVPEGGSAIDVLRVYKPTIPRATRESLRAVLSRFSENGWDRGRLLLLQGDLGSLLRQTLSGVRLSGNLGGRA